ncbi:hypothetical protein K9L16_01050 [Candidatus Pacearchaeota archaeon]|nr:hypothetical protein [Candidatus Pacearchaeota archaeon]
MEFNKKEGIVILVFILVLIFSIFNFALSPKICGDRTLTGNCSIHKPYYCLDGNLVLNSSFCGCPVFMNLKENDCVSKYETGASEKTFNYVLDGREKELSIEVYEGVANYLSKIPRNLNSNGNNLSREDFIFREINEPIQEYYLTELVKKIENITGDKVQQARIAISLVQNIPYGSSEKQINFAGYKIQYARYPYEVLFEEKGICGEKSELLVFLLREFGYETAMFIFSEENHAAVGIACPISESFNNTGYCFIETTAPSILSAHKNNYIGQNVLNSNPEIIKLSEGESLPKNLKEYKNSESWITLHKKMQDEGEVNWFQYKKMKNIAIDYGISFG